uniref:Uncharacterized protein n=1 Tax=Aegilops tauschii subsp. strangulata TaxID=200361 RepID=A0A453D476_AEGTS
PIPTPPRHHLGRADDSSPAAAAMGASSSTANAPAEARELREQEALASAALSLPLLRAVFSRSPDLAATLSLPPASFRSASPLETPAHFQDLLASLGPTIASLFFSRGASKDAGAGGWVGFLRGFNSCCARAR